MSIRVRVEGLDRVTATLRNVSEGVKRGARREVKRAALNVQNGAKRRAPVDTGRMRNSISHQTVDDDLTAEIGTNVEYAPHVEFGTRSQQAQPFLHPALEEERPQFERRLRDLLRSGGK